jgi:DNA-binding LacI/PurR family transcriptional regulator
LKVTIKDIAEKAGVSKTAVSFAFNNPQRISKTTYEKIMNIAKEVGYSPDPVARILATRKTQAIGLLLPQTLTEVFKNPYISEVVRGIGDICEKESLALTILSPQKGIVTHSIQSAAVDGMIALGVDSHSDIHEAFKQRQMPYVTIDAENAADYLNVGIDNEVVAKRLMDLLLDLGHRRICFCALLPISEDLIGTDGSITMTARRNGIMQSVQQHNIDAETINQFSFAEIGVSLQSSYKLAKQELQKPTRPTAIYCMGDAQAFGFYRAAQELNISIPKELSIVSFDDLPINKALYPSLTCVHQPGFEKGRTAAELLVKKIAGKHCESIVMSAHIENRNSTAPVT